MGLILDNEMFYKRVITKPKTRLKDRYICNNPLANYKLCANESICEPIYWTR